MTEQRTVRVRIAVAVDMDGSWCASGYEANDAELQRDVRRMGTFSDANTAWHWIEADVPVPTVPQVQVVEGRVAE